MTTRNRLLATTAAALLCCATLTARDAHAGPGHWRWRGRTDPVGAVVTGLVVGALVGGLLGPPPVVVESYPAPTYYHYGPPVTVAPPAPVMVVQAPRLASPTVGLAVSGVMQSLGRDRGLTAGAALNLQYRTSPHALLSLELQSLQAPRAWDGVQRSDMAALVGARLFPWDWVLSPFVDVAAGFGRASFECCRFEEHASQFLGRYGVGIELRLGPHLVLDGQVAQVHRLRLDQPGPGLGLVDDHERASEVRAGFAFLF